MKALPSVIFLCVIGLVASADVARRFRKAKIEPDVVSKAPTDFIEVKYGNKRVNLGNKFSPLETLLKPRVHFNHTKDDLYTLVMTEPNIPTPGQFLHWLVGNIPNGSVSKGETIAVYIMPAALTGLGEFRYTFLLYKQDQGYINYELSDSLQRALFYVEDFAEEHNLGDPVAGNFFIAPITDLSILKK